MVKKAKLQVVVLIAFAMFFVTLCPSVCQAFTVHTTAHSCCPSEAPKESQQNQKESCCEKYENLSLKQDSTQMAIEFLTLPLLMVVTESTLLSTPNQTYVSNMQESPPGIIARGPLYVINSSYLI